MVSSSCIVMWEQSDEGGGLSLKDKTSAEKERLPVLCYGTSI